MKPSRILRHIIAALFSTLAFGKRVDNRLRGQNNNAVPTVSEPAPANATHTGEMFDLDVAHANNVSTPGFNDPGRPDRIPVSHWGCTGVSLRPREIRGALDAIVAWSDAGNRLEGKSLHVEKYEGVGAWVCNCKWFDYDSAPNDEVYEFYDRLMAHCGRGRSGWLYSKQWDKGYAVDTDKHVDSKHPQALLCPQNCCR
ncbi:hypothetical protein GGR54DRAFT_26912 [Hypoxylon sp. NC1633]|nr:hypothetical protein GGR54DRAFT_26912 [Hypoxylon sp. NC1633]